MRLRHKDPKTSFPDIAKAMALIASIVFSSRDALAADCKDRAATEPLSSGLSRLTIQSPCRKGEKIKIRYDAVEFIRSLNEKGELDFVLDCFLGETPGLMITFKDQAALTPNLRTLDIDRVTKVAVLWKGAVNLDLHAFEYGAEPSAVGHIWAAAPSTRWDAEEAIKKDKRGHGFISFASEGTSEGGQLEVYTFVHDPGQTSGAIRLALDYESRARLPQDPDTCGTGLYADMEYKVVVRHANGRTNRSRGTFAPMECNRPMDQIARFNSKTMPQLLLTR